MDTAVENKPLEFMVGEGGVLTGMLPTRACTSLTDVVLAFNLAVPFMVPGEIDLIKSAGKFAYAERGSQVYGIAPDEPVEFEVELLSVERQYHGDAMKVEDAVAIAQRDKDLGNERFQQGQYDTAAQLYDKAIANLDSLAEQEQTNQVDVTKTKPLYLSCLLNAAAAKLKLKQFKEAITHCDSALILDASNVKAMYRKAQVGQ